MTARKNPPTPPMSDAERAARIDEMKRLCHWITTRDDWCSILGHVGLRAAQLQHHMENMPHFTWDSEEPT